MTETASSTKEHNCTCLNCKIPFYAKPSVIVKGGGKYCSIKCRRKSQKWTPERFWANVNRTESCWLWEGPVTSRGYGSASACNSEGNYVSKQAHRLAWELLNGPVPKGMHVLHNCPKGDNKLCVNPLHLYIGNHRDNMRDAVNKGQLRPRRGSANGQSKLTEDGVKELRKHYSTGNYSPKYLSKLYGISTGIVHKIIQRKTWRHI